MSEISAAGTAESSIYNLYKNMNLSSAVESDNLALSWLEKHGKTFFGYVDGCWISQEKIEKEIKSEVESCKICDYFTGKHLCDIYASIDKNLLFYATQNSASGFKYWSSQPPLFRSQVLHKIAQTLEKYQLLFAAVEAISSGRHFSIVKKRDVPNLIESFIYYSGFAIHLENVSKDWFPVGPVCILTEEYNNSSMTLSLRVSSVLASGNSVLLLSDVKSSLSSLLLAEICSNAGLPDGVLNVIPVNQAKLPETGQLDTFSKLIFTGSLEKSLPYSKLNFKANIPYDILIPKRPVIIVYENSDLNSAANGVLEAFFSHDTRSKSSGCKVMMQESIREKFLIILKGYFDKILVGQNMSKTDMSCIVTEAQKSVLMDSIKKVDKTNEKIAGTPYNNCNYVHMKPILISTLQCNSKLLHGELGGPIIVTVTFRTVKESLAMFNCDNRGSPVSIWTEKISVALEVAQKLKTGTVWVNSECVIDTQISFSGTFFSGNSVEGGKDSLFSHMSVIKNEESISDHQSKNTAGLIKEVEENASLQRKEKDVHFDKIISMPSNPENDMQNAISKAVAAQIKWESFTDYQKKSIFIDVIEKLKVAREDFSKLVNTSGSSMEEEIAETLNLLYYFAYQYDKFNIPVQEIKKNFLALQIRNPVGVIGIECGDITKPLLSFVSLVISAIVHGNTVVALVNEHCPKIAVKMCEIFSSAKIPGGVVNVIWGNKTRLLSALCKHTDVNAIWFSTVSFKDVYADCNVTKRVFYCNKMWTNFNEAKSLKFVMESTYIKSIFLPAGDIFAN